MRISESGQFAKSQRLNPGAKVRIPPMRLSPSQNLLYSVLQVAQEDLRLAQRADPTTGAKLKADVLGWLDAPEDGPRRPVVTLADCCEALGWDAEAVKRAMLGA